MARIGLYGGTFNPIHNGHIGVCRQAVEQLELDVLHLMPAFVPPHKAAPDLADEDDRLAMCRLAAGETPHVLVDDYELKKGGISYSVETVRHLRECYPEDHLFLVMGTDNFLDFKDWYCWQEIGALCTLAVASRELDDKNELLQQANHLLAEYGINTVFLQNTVRVISSTEIREAFRRNQPCTMVPAAVAEYIVSHQLYETKQTEMPIEEMREAVRPLMSAKRYRHSLGVEKEAVRLAMLYGEDPHKAAVAGILHDCCKEMPLDEALQIVRQSDIMTEIIFEDQPYLIHGFAASCILSRYGVADADIANAVRYHTVARRGMSRLEQIIYLADLTEEGRDYPDAEKMRQLTDTSLQAGMCHALCFTLSKLTQKKRPICRETWEAYNEYITIEKENV